MPRKAATATETTPCPSCRKAIPVRGERGACPSCGLKVRFVDAPERPCRSCGRPVPLPPGQDAVRCAACGRWQAAEEGRPVLAEAACPRCRRVVLVPLDEDKAECPRCGASLSLADSL